MADSVAIINPGGGSGGSSTYNPPNCVDGPGLDGVTSSSPHLTLGQVYDYNRNLGSLAAFDAVVMARAPGYMQSGSTGGAHVNLWGYGNLASGNLGITGSTIITTGVVTLWGSDIGPRPSEWHHWARIYSIDGASNGWVYDYWNGLMIQALKLYTGTSGSQRVTPSPGTGSDADYLFHSDHQNGNGRLAFFRRFEGGSPLGNTQHDNFVPARPLGNFWGTARANQALYLGGDLSQFNDLSDGYNQAVPGTAVTGGTIPSPVYKHNALKGNGKVNANSVIYPGWPVPASVYDADCPVNKVGDIWIPNGGYAPPAGSADGSPLCWDDFNRGVATSLADTLAGIGPQDYYRTPYSGPNLGSTQAAGASLGSLTYTQVMSDSKQWSVPVFGRAAAIQYGSSYASLRSNAGDPCLFGVTHASMPANHAIYVKRSADSVTSTLFQLSCFARGVDNNNYLVLWTSPFDPRNMFLDSYDAGVRTNLANIAPTISTWTKMMLWCQGTTIRCYVDDPAGVTLTGIPGKWQKFGVDYTDSNGTRVTNGKTLGPTNGGTSASTNCHGIWHCTGWQAYAT